MENDFDKRYQTLLVLWFALLMSIGSFFVFSLFFVPESQPVSGQPPNSLLIVVLTAPGALLVLLSFVVKHKLLERSVEKQDVSLVQKGLVFTCAMCEASALLGLIERLTINSRDYYLLFGFAAAGIAFHFPRRNQLEAASSRNPGQPD